MTGQLFTHYFLTDGIKTTPEWQASVDQPEAFTAFRNGVARHHGRPQPFPKSQRNGPLRPRPRLRRRALHLGRRGTPPPSRRLDALYFHLYGLSRDDAEYVLDTFPIVRREDEAACGTYRTRDMTLAYMNALAAGDTEAVVV